MRTTFGILLYPLRGTWNVCVCSFALLLRVFRSLLGLLEPLGGLLGWSWKLFGWFGGVLKTPLNFFWCSGTYLEISWSVFESSWGLFFCHFLSFWSSWRGSRTSRDLSGPLFSKMGAPPRREHDFRNLYEQEREPSY